MTAVGTPADFDRAGVPEIPTTPVPRCPLCGAGESERFAEGFDYELTTCRNRWRFVQCRGCEHVWLDPRPALSALPVIYPKHYYAYNFATRVHPIAVKGKAWLDRRRMAAIVRRCRGPITTYLDVGCGDGRFLRAMEAAGVPRAGLLGLELDAEVARGLREAGYRVDCARIEEATIAAPGSVDLVTMFHVIEHVDQPAEAVAKVVEWLAPGGVFALETPNRDSLDARWFRRTFWGGYHIPRHWNLFSTDGVVRLFEQAGLEVDLVSHQPGHSFWLYSLHHWLKFGSPSLPRLARWFDPIGALFPLIVATGFDKLRALMGFRTSAVLVVGRKPGGGAARELPARSDS
ncbi:MAG: class I SAM-dependent methyltransferase [Gemmatimonadales bacterium]